MKKIILSTLILTALYSCKKEGKKVETATDTAAVSKKTEPAVAAAFIKETSPEDVSKYLAKNNDTLYVTNFFATWCGPCMREIPHFKNKIQELKGKPVKFTFIDMDDKSEWNSAVKKFADENNLADHIILVDGKKLDQNFFKSNFKQWDGGSIPFTYMRKGAKTDELLGMITEEVLNEKINSFLK
ncbi:thiol-disulfide isomerase/thioredoxin [Chryseobacterium sp. H1D6B]|uniref:TlpA family protein disulfide reductase n=1 Tax=Chryseobacterium sp. H1D6B TaxID=2940588 RepID=UPI0015CC1D2D|nr:thioredoxin domain-containing protein [Chryseobacterium sp. H1D6B]MDH6253644.1 thiol-disulfide isomerase/thioredoxin [Chryseobacterium sp. H1D6B]